MLEIVYVNQAKQSLPKTFTSIGMLNARIEVFFKDDLLSKIMPTPLPIDNIKADFLSALKSNFTLILSAEPGAGKSTRLPLWLLEDNLAIQGKVYLLQPRRVAAKNIAIYLAAQIGEPVGQSVGYRLRNESKVSKNTRLEVITEGILVQIMQADPELANTSLIIFDEFHERSLQADLAFALARDIQQGLREDLRLLLMSATLANDELQKALPDALSLKTTGRSFPVTVEYQPIKNIRAWRDQAAVVIKQTLITHQGSILVFLPSSADIRYLATALENIVNAELVVCPLYGDLSLAEQQRAIQPCKENVRKIVLATNIAETSLTIEGINIVIDSGLEKVAIYDENTLTNKLLQRNIAKSSAIQRMGRAGRLSAGHCIRLFNEEEFQRRSLQSGLAIHQADILPVVIEAARWQVSRLADIPLLDFPNEAIENQAWQTLINIDVVDEKRKLTPHGLEVVQLPCHARFAHMIIQAKTLEQKYDCKGFTFLACLLAALLEERDVFSIEQSRGNSDISQRIRFILSNNKNYKSRQILLQAKKLADKIQVKQISNLPLGNIGILVYLAYPERLLKRRNNAGDYLASYGKGVTLDLHDALNNEEYLVAAHLTQFQQQLQVRLAAIVDIQQLTSWKLAKQNYHESLHYDEKSGRINAVKQKKIGAIILEEKAEKALMNEDDVFAIWLEQLKKHGLTLLKWKKEDKDLLLRWQWLNSISIDNDFPDVSGQSLIKNASLWFKPYVSNITTKAQLLKLNVSEMLLTMLDYQQQQLLNKCVPSYYVGPTGRKCTIRYSLEHAPVVSLPMQEVYGLKTSPAVGDEKSKVNLTFELLSPAQRPIQITADLAGFWRGSYKAVQKEMKAQYPKHYWPDDPANAIATNKTKKYALIK
ncbi:ATP-dependent helicase HrpB [Thalassotalea profundi]|uniref:ATP-dependent helicase n=1 Tax=Thalassotalea profundi TaxID=2036687 RepID=A0ABQ3J0K8_9GAMM|nr:ATP-dependent helicase HrpB [Thalassotalea profundi]GHF00479.1 ATP-dependent helicase [Thalassotalea profundi]